MRESGVVFFMIWAASFARFTAVVERDGPTDPPHMYLKRILFWQLMADVMRYIELPVLV